MKRFILIALLVLIPTFAFSATVEVSWNANTEADMASYNVYQGATLVGNVLHPTTKYTVNNLADGTYSFSVTAVDTSGNESLRSDAVSIKIDTTAPAKPTGIKAIIIKLIAWLKSITG